MRVLQSCALVPLALIVLCPVTAGQTRFVDQGNGTVKDTKTNLVWLKDQSKAVSRPTDPDSDWDEATALSKRIQSGDYGLTDGSKAGEWRLPKEAELRAFANAINELEVTQRNELFKCQEFIQLRFWTSSERKDGSCAVMNTRSLNTLMSQRRKQSVTYKDTAMPKTDRNGTVWPVRKANAQGK